MSTGDEKEIPEVETAEQWGIWVRQEEDAMGVHDMASLNFDAIGEDIERPLYEEPDFLRGLLEMPDSATLIDDYLALVLGKDWRNLHSNDTRDVDHNLMRYAGEIAAMQDLSGGQLEKAIRDANSYLTNIFAYMGDAYRGIMRNQKSLRASKPAEGHDDAMLQSMIAAMNVPDQQPPESLDAASFHSAVTHHSSEISKADLDAVASLPSHADTETLSQVIRSIQNTPAKTTPYSDPPSTVASQKAPTVMTAETLTVDQAAQHLPEVPDLPDFSGATEAMVRALDPSTYDDFFTSIIATPAPAMDSELSQEIERSKTYSSTKWTSRPR